MVDCERVFEAAYAKARAIFRPRGVSVLNREDALQQAGLEVLLKLRRGLVTSEVIATSWIVWRAHKRIVHPGVDVEEFDGERHKAGVNPSAHELVEDAERASLLRDEIRAAGAFELLLEAEGYSDAEIGELVGKPANTVNQSRFRGRARVQKALEEMGWQR